MLEVLRCAHPYHSGHGQQGDLRMEYDNATGYSWFSSFTHKMGFTYVYYR